MQAYLTGQLHLNRKSEGKQAGLIVLDEIMDSSDTLWGMFAQRWSFNIS